MRSQKVKFKKNFKLKLNSLFELGLKKVPDESQKAETKEAKSANKEKKNVKSIANKSTKDANKFKHKLLACSLKAHSDSVTGIDFSPNGKHLVSCASGIDDLILAKFILLIKIMFF